jgi:hypothetical protein
VAAFALKLTASFLITKYLWALPLGPDHLRCNIPYAVQDSNIYDLDAKRLVEHGLLSLEGLSGAWLSFGVVRYIAIIYKLFGVSVLYVSMFNALLSLVACIFLTGTLKTLDLRNLRKWQLTKYGMFLPILAYYDATPSKEPLTLAAFFMGLFFLSKMLYSKRDENLYFGMLMIACILLALTRISVLLLFIAISVSLGIFSPRMGTARRTVLACIVPLLLCGIFWVTYSWVVGRKLDSSNLRESFVSIAAHLDQAKKQLAVKKEASGGHPLKVKVLELLFPQSIWTHLAFSPVRTVLWVYSPYPLIIPDVYKLIQSREIVHTNYRDYISITAHVFPQLSSWLIIILTPSVMAAFLDTRSDGASRRWLLIIAVLVTAFSISNILLIEFTRQKFLAEPMILSLALWGYANGRPRRYYSVVYFLLAGVLAVNWLAKVV